MPQAETIPRNDTLGLGYGYKVLHSIIFWLETIHNSMSLREAKRRGSLLLTAFALLIPYTPKACHSERSVESVWNGHTSKNVTTRQCDGNQTDSTPTALNDTLHVYGAAPHALCPKGAIPWNYRNEPIPSCFIHRLA